MNKEQRMKNTQFYEFTNLNPKEKFVGDCVVRAIALACNQTWEQTVRDMTEFGIKKGLLLNDQELFPLYLKSKGFTQEKEPRDDDNCKISIKQWLMKGCNRYRVYIVKAGSHHINCVIDKKVRDTWDSSEQTMHRYWRKSK